MNRIKKYLPDVLVVLMFAAISFAYFFPADIEGKILRSLQGEDRQDTTLDELRLQRYADVSDYALVQQCQRTEYRR